MDKVLFSSLFSIGERIPSGNPDNPRSSAFLDLVAIEEEGFRYKSVRNQSSGKFTYAYIDVVLDGFERIDPFSIQRTIQDVFLARGYKKNVSTENYAYGFAREIRLRTTKPFLCAGEVIDTGDWDLPKGTGANQFFREGASIRVLVDRRERSPQARAACIKEHGLTCKVCGFNFESFYGIIGRSFIHVHHLSSVATTKERRSINPSSDLVPLCANCHAMVHTANPPLTVAALLELIPRSRTLLVSP